LNHDKKANQPELDEAFVMLREQVAESATVSNLTFLTGLNEIVCGFTSYLLYFIFIMVLLAAWNSFSHINQSDN
jgi:hypothetical protein